MSNTQPISTRYKAVFALALPIIGGMVSQNVLNLVDTAMVGTLGTEALASVGLGSFLNFSCGAFLMGLSVGVQTLCARWRGAQREDYAVPLNAGLILSAVIGLPLTYVLIVNTPTLMTWVSDTPAIQSLGGEYLQARLYGMAAVGASFCFRSYWSAVEMTLIYLVTLIAMHIINIFLNWVLIFGHLGFEPMGVEGAGVGSAISAWIGVGLYTIFAIKYALPHGFLKKGADLETWRELLRMSIPSGIERVFFALSMTLFMTLMGRIGPEALAASNVILNLFLVAILPALGFGIASATFVARSIGANTPKEADLWRIAVNRCAMICLTVISIFFAIAPDWICHLFIQESAPLILASDTLRLMALCLPFEALHMVTYQSLIGLGDNRVVMMMNLTTQWLLMLPLVYLIGVNWGGGVMWAWGIHFGARVLVMLCYTARWRGLISRLAPT